MGRRQRVCAMIEGSSPFVTLGSARPRTALYERGSGSVPQGAPSRRVARLGSGLAGTEISAGGWLLFSDFSESEPLHDRIGAALAGTKGAGPWQWLWTGGSSCHQIEQRPADMGLRWMVAAGGPEVAAGRVLFGVKDGMRWRRGKIKQKSVNRKKTKARAHAVL
jgi:hypothetical protein